MPYTTENTKDRTFDINRPLGQPTKAFIFCHGRNGNSTSVAEKLGNPDPIDYYLVFPNGSHTPDEPDLNKRMWNSSGDILSLVEAGFFGSIINHLHSLGVTDIGIGGHSNGASMAAYLLAAYPEYFNNAMFVSGYLHNDITDIKNSDVPIKHIHGINDNIIPLIGSEYDIKEHLVKFIEAGYFVRCELLPYDHDLNNLNTDGLIRIEMEKLMGL